MMSAVGIIGCVDPPDLVFDSPYDPQSPLFVPAAVSDLRVADPSEGSRALSWVGHSKSAAAYRVERKLGSDGKFSLLAHVTPPATSYLDTTGIMTDTTYYYRVACQAANGNAATGDSVPVSIPFPPPVDLRMTCISPSEIRLEWVDSSQFETGFTVEQSVNGGAFQRIGMTLPDSTQAHARSLTPGSVYRFRVAAITRRNVSRFSNVIGARSVSLPFERICSTPPPGSTLHSLTFSPDGAFIAGGGIYTIDVWRASDGARVRVLSHGDLVGPVVSLSFAPRGDLLMAAHFDHVDVWNVMSGVLERTFTWSGFTWIGSVSIDPTGQRLVCGTYGGAIVSDAQSGSLLRVIDGPGNPQVARLSPDGQTIAVGDIDSGLTMYRSTDGAIVRSIPEATRVSALALSPDGRTVATSSRAELLVKLWDVASGGLLRTLSPQNVGQSVEFSPDGLWVAACGSGLAPSLGVPTEFETMLWQVSDGTLVTSFPGTPSTDGVAFSPFGNLIAIGVVWSVDVWAVQGTWVMTP